MYKGDMVLSVALGLCFILFDLEACLLGKRNWENNLGKEKRKEIVKKERERCFTNKKFPRRGINMCWFDKSVTWTSMLNLKHQNCWHL